MTGCMAGVYQIPNRQQVDDLTERCFDTLSMTTKKGVTRSEVERELSRTKRRPRQFDDTPHAVLLRQRSRRIWLLPVVDY